MKRIENIYLCSIDDLAQVASDNIKLREGEMEQAIEIICNAVSAFSDWLLRCSVGPVIGEIKAAFGQICKNEISRWAGEPDMSASPERMEAAMERVVNKLCHCVIGTIERLSREHGAADARKFAQGVLADAQKMISDNRKKVP